MATTRAFGGSLSSTPLFQSSNSGDMGGGESVTDPLSIAFSAAGGTAPTISGFLKGTGSVSGATDLLLAHGTDPFAGGGDAVYSSGFTVASSKLKYLRIRNTHASAALLVQRGATNGLPVFEAAEDGYSIPAGGHWEVYLPAGTAALTTGSNDKLTVTPSTGTVTFVLIAAYGP